MQYTGIAIMFWSNISHKRIWNSEDISFHGYLISQFCGFETFCGDKISRKWSKIVEIAEFNTCKI